MPDEGPFFGEKMIYVLEDDKNIRKMLSYALAREGFVVEGFERADAMYEAMEKRMPRLVLLDIMLPGEDGFCVLEKLKAGHGTRQIPVIVLTAKNSEIDKLRGLDGGADDYVTKPFGIAELVARIRAVLRRCDMMPEQRTYQLQALQIDDERHVVTVDGERVPLSKKEYDLLLMLAKAEGNVCTREALLGGVWGENYGESRTLDVHIRRIRKKLSSMGALIETVKGVGYRMAEDADGVSTDGEDG